jgi:hypothetical protein
LHWVLRISALTSLLGLVTPLSVGVQAACVALFFGGAQLSGTVTHNLHLLWFLALLALAPSGEVLSLDAWLRRRTLLQFNPSLEAAVATFTARVLLGLVYLFPGIQKLRASGLAWAFSDNLTNQLRFKWFMADGVVPSPRLDHFPSLVQALACGVLLFELCFVGLSMCSKTRPLAATAGLAFHFGIQHFMYIPFSSLWLCYGMLWDGPRPKLSVRSTSAGRRGALLVLSALLVTGVTWRGVVGETQAWPFACYPSFATRAPDAIVDLALEVTTAEGATRSLRRERTRPSQEWGTIWRLLGLYDGNVDKPGLRALALTWLARDASLRPPLQVRFYAEAYSTDPDRAAEPPLRRTLVDEVNFQ